MTLSRTDAGVDTEELGVAIAQLSPEQLAVIKATVEAVVQATGTPKITGAETTSELFSRDFQVGSQSKLCEHTEMT